MMRVDQHWSDPGFLKEFPQVEPVVACRFHPGNHGILTMRSLYVKYPCLELCEPGFRIAELERFL